MSAYQQYRRNYKLGQAMAQLYIAAQEGVSQEVSDQVCAMVEAASPVAKVGFDEEMRKTSYQVRASALVAAA